MEKLDYKALANQLMFDLSEEEIQEIDEEFQVLLQQLNLLDEIDTSGVEEMVFPLDLVTSYMREDTVGSVLCQDEALRNAAKVKEGHVHVPKVLK